jgi:prepilin-type processing-associated H-X9-DG protein
MGLYAQQYRTYPGGFAAYGIQSGTIFIWPVRLRPMLGGDRRVFLCPSRDDRFEWSDSAPGPVVRASGIYVRLGYEQDERLITWETLFSYGYNAHGTMGTPYRGTGLGDAAEEIHVRQHDYQPELKFSRVKAPAEMIAVADSTADGKWDAFVGPKETTPYLLPGRVHNGGANVLFCDGHVTWYLQRDLTLPESVFHPAYTSRALMWNYDHTDGIERSPMGP